MDLMEFSHDGIKKHTYGKSNKVLIYTGNAKNTHQRGLKPPYLCLVTACNGTVNATFKWKPILADGSLGKEQNGYGAFSEPVEEFDLVVKIQKK